VNQLFEGKRAGDLEMERKRERKRVRDRVLFHAIVTEGGRGAKARKSKSSKQGGR